MKSIFLKAMLAIIFFSGSLVVYAQKITVNIEDYKQVFQGAGGTCDSYLSHWVSMSASNRDLAAKMITQDINLKYVKNYINNVAAVSASTYDNFVSFVNDIRVYNPNIKVQISIQDLPDHLEKSDGNGGTLKGQYDPNIANIFDEIANYYFQVIKDFDDRGVTVSELDLLNEPGGVGVAIYLGQLFSEAIPRLRSIINDPIQNPNNLPMPLVVGTSQWSVNGTIKWFEEWKNNGLQAAYDEIDIVSTHGYEGGWVESNYQAITDYIGGLPFMNNEQTGKLQAGDGLHEVFGSNDPDYIGDVSMALRISDAINGGVEHFFIFNLNNPTGNNAALLKTPFNGDPTKSKVYSGFKQLTSFQSDDSTVLGKTLTNIGGNRVLCYRKLGENAIYVNITNVTSNNMSITLDAKDALNSIAGINKVEAWVSNEQLDEEKVLDITYAQSVKEIIFNADPFSVNTLKISIDPNGYETSLSSQTITFSPLPDKVLGNADFDLSATSSSGLPVSFSLISGPATINGNTVSLTGVGAVTVKASQLGDDLYFAANDIYQTFIVSPEFPNIALGKPVTVSSFNTSYPASNLVDGDKVSNSSRWLSAGGESYPQWVEIDLGADYVINSFAFWTGFTTYKSPISDFDLQFWNGTVWETVFTETGNTNPEFLTPIPDIKTNKIRLNLTDADSYPAKIFELELYGYLLEASNVAIGKSILAKSEHSSGSYPVTNLIDGDNSSNSSRWLSSSTSSLPQWFVIDLQGEHVIKGINFWTGYNGYKNPIIDFDFEIWKDGAWNQVFKESGNSRASFLKTFEEIQTNQVRFSITDSGSSSVIRMFEFEVYGNTGTLDVNSLALEKISIYPNPVKGNYLYLKNLKEITGLEIYNLLGEKKKCNYLNNKIDVEYLSSGMYFLRINNNRTIKFLKE